MWYVVYHVCLLVQTFVTVTCNKSWRSKLASLTAKLCVTIAMSLLYSPQYCLGRPSLTILSLFIHKAAWSKLCHRLICFASSNNQMFGYFHHKHNYTAILWFSAVLFPRNKNTFKREKLARMCTFDICILSHGDRSLLPNCLLSTDGLTTCSSAANASSNIRCRESYLTWFCYKF